MAKEQERTKENIIFIGSKPFMNYVSGIVLQFTTNKAEKVTIKSRGKFISKAVDVAEISKNKFLKELNIKIDSIQIGSEPFETKEGKKLSVSTMEIALSK
jgi:DNA-binding protein